MKLWVSPDRPLFCIDYVDDRQLDILKSISTARKKARESVITFKPSIWAVRGLLDNIENGNIIPGDESLELISQIQKEYKQKRIELRAAELRFKKYGEYLPVPLKSKPFLHQAQAFGFGVSLDCSGILMEQGTGKTFVALAIMVYRFLKQQSSRCLIICPKPVLPVWPGQFKKHMDFDCPVHINEFPSKFQADSPQVVLINYDRVNNFKKEINKWSPDHIILDESHKLQNRSTKRSRSVHSIGKKAKYRNIMTGTPIGQSPISIFSQYLFLDPDVFGTQYRDFDSRYVIRGGFKNFQIKGYKNLKELSRKVHDISFRATKDECLDLPQRVYQNLYCQLSSKNRKLYKQMLEKFGVTVGGVTVEVDRVISQSMKLRQLAGGSLISGDLDRSMVPISSDKIKVLKEFLEAWDRNKKILIFVAFTHELNMIGDLLDELKFKWLRLDGSVPQEERNKLENSFNLDPSYDILVAQISTGAEGLDFTGASTTIFYSPIFSLVGYLQARDRTHRIGATGDSVSYINLIMEDTIDEHIIQSLIETENLAKNLLEVNRNYKPLKGKVKQNG